MVFAHSNSDYQERQIILESRSYMLLFLPKDAAQDANIKRHRAAPQRYRKRIRSPVIPA
jgi:hypothetical protein